MTKKSDEAPVVVIDGMPFIGCYDLARALANDFGVIERSGNTREKGAYEWMQETLQFPDQPLILHRFHLTAACYMKERTTDLNIMQWFALDEAIARRGAVIVMLVDTPQAVEVLATGHHRDWTRARIGNWLENLNLALKMSKVQQKGSYRLKQFLDPETGERTAQYDLLLKAIREVRPIKW